MAHASRLLRVQPACQMGLCHLVNSTHQRRHAHRGFTFPGKLQCPVECRGDDLVQPVPDILLIPEKPLHVLNPFKIRHDYAARIGEDIGAMKRGRESFLDRIG